MRPLSASDMLRLWEIGQSQHPLDRALTLLAVACPEKSQAELAALEIGRRDAYLLTLRELTLGSQLDSFAECPQCRERLEFSLKVADIRQIDPDVPFPPSWQRTVEGVDVQFRSLNSLDLAAMMTRGATNPDPTDLLRRCFIQASREGKSVQPDDLTAETIAHLKTELLETDPQAEILIDLSCPACHHEWQILFDIVEFFWIELTAQAKRLLRDIHVLARAYGWREADILAMSPLRRTYYLNLVNG